MYKRQVEDILGIDDDDFCQCDDDECDCDDCDDDCYFDEDADVIEVECPECGETVCFYDEMLDEDCLLYTSFNHKFC